MGLEKVKQEILEKARKEAAEITDAAKAEAKTIMRSAEKQMQNYELLIVEDVSRSVEQMKRRQLASAELGLQKQALAAKNELIESVFSDVRKRLRQLEEKKRETHVKSLLEIAGKEIDVAVVHCNARDAEFLWSYGKLGVVKDDTLLGGIIAESSDGRLRVDYSYETVLEQVKSKVLSDVARLLFGK